MLTFALVWAFTPRFFVLAAGGVWPLFAVLYAEIISTMVGDGSSEALRNWALGFVGLAVFVFIFMSIQHTCLHASGESITMRLREVSRVRISPTHSSLGARPHH